MNHNYNISEILFTIIFIICCLGISIMLLKVGERVGVERMQHEAIEKSFAHYNPQTGIWQCNEK